MYRYSETSKWLDWQIHYYVTFLGEDPETRRMRTVKNIADLRQNLEETMSSLRGTQISHRFFFSILYIFGTIRKKMTTKRLTLLIRIKKEFNVLLLFSHLNFTWHSAGDFLAHTQGLFSPIHLFFHGVSLSNWISYWNYHHLYQLDFHARDKQHWAEVSVEMHLGWEWGWGV